MKNDEKQIIPLMLWNENALLSNLQTVSHYILKNVFYSKIQMAHLSDTNLPSKIVMTNFSFYLTKQKCKNYSVITII